MKKLKSERPAVTVPEQTAYRKGRTLRSLSHSPLPGEYAACDFENLRWIVHLIRAVEPSGAYPKQHVAAHLGAIEKAAFALLHEPNSVA